MSLNFILAFERTILSEDAKMKKFKVGITGINAVDNPGPGIGVARSLKEISGSDIEIIGLAYDAMEPGIYMDWVVDKSYLMPYPSAGGEAYMDRLEHIQKTNGLDCLIPNLDAELPIYIKYAGSLAQRGIRTFLPDMRQFRLRGKDKLDEISDRMGICIPRTRVVTSVEKLLEAIEDIKLPVMVKGIFYKAYIAHTTEEAITHYHEIVAEWGLPIIVQEVVSGIHINLVGLGDGAGGHLGFVGIKKVSMTVAGKIWTGVTIRNPALLAAAEAFVREYKWKGPFELECILSDDTAYLIEINPRFPAWTYFATGVGINLPERLLRRMFDEDCDTGSDYEAGKLFIRYSYELVTDMNVFQSVVTSGEYQ